MSDEKGWNEMRKAKEDMYFAEQEKAALERMKKRAKERPSPITGRPMEQVNFKGVVIDRCVDSGGIWLDAGELEQIIKASTQENKEGGENWLGHFFDFLQKK